MRPTYKIAVFAAAVLLFTACSHADDNTAQSAPDARGTFERAGAKVDKEVEVIKEKSSEIADKAVDKAHEVKQVVVEKADEAHGWVKDKMASATPTP